MSDKELNSQAAIIFENAASYIRTYGWQVKGMGEHGKPRCSMGALASSYRTKRWNSKISELMYRKLYEELDGLTLTKFNFKHRNGEKVAQLFEQVSSKLSMRSSVKTM